MKQFSQQMTWGFSLEGETTNQTLPAEQSLEVVALLARLEEFTENRNHHHYFCSRMMEFLDLVRERYRSVGHRVKLVSKIPLGVIRYSLTKQPHCHAYRFANVIYRKGQCSTDITVPYKLKDHLRVEVKTVFDMSYILKFDGEVPVAERRVTADDAKIRSVIETMREIDHPTFVLDTFKLLGPMTPERVYVGKMYSVRLSLLPDGGFTIHFLPNKANNDRLVYEYRDRRSTLNLYTSVNQAQLEVTEDLMFEMLHCLYREVNYQVNSLKAGRARQFGRSA